MEPEVESNHIPSTANVSEGDADSESDENAKHKSRFQLCHLKIQESWKPEDDKTLYNVALFYKLDWKKIAKKFEKTTTKKVTPTFLRKRYQEIKPSYQHKDQHLSEEHDDKKGIKLHGEDWEQISRMLDNMDPIKIRNRYFSQIVKKMRKSGDDQQQ
eukprot:CAMPEP_0114587114 /NCGR_PEP_ID=MMETSP0125-20121206/10157_1 /TAXON_ID=485358 ORGANISM="Aristerostoma sp., Strain ATCC 50986" /NCGR_SAMPLE_ID=MMETSP0125 /ASSEMBLY_ACC=CAM_ASM_000245 /LENGTH=156 /DNA_ID=CAMNT_0001782867 /DNA_START=200 /DNA_END=670 /DNA_ORIENTATION=+